MSRFSWVKSRDRLRKLLEKLEAEKRNQWNAPDGASWDYALARIIDDLDAVVDGITAQRCGGVK